MRAFLCRFFATGAFSGYSPAAPGTAGSLLALILYLLFPGLRGNTLALLLAGIIPAGAAAAGEIEKSEGHDAQIIVIDEIAGQWLALYLLPAGANTAAAVCAFIAFRILDIFKPSLINRAQNIRGGWGVMADDIAAGAVAGVLIHLLVLLLPGLLT